MRKLLLLLLFILGLFYWTDKASASVFYIDFENGSDVAAGTATTTAFQSLNQFTNNARSAGDIAFVRRGMTSSTNVTAVTFTSDGNLNNPITISADYDNLWNDFVTSTQTYTVTFGSKFIASSASSTDVAIGKWVYVASDCGETYNSSSLNLCEYAYEIASSSPAGFDLYLPYKGNQAGAGNFLRVMPAAPVYGSTGDTVAGLTGSSDFLLVF